MAWALAGMSIWRMPFARRSASTIAFTAAGAALGLVRGPKPQAVRRCQNPTYAYESPRGLKCEVPWMRMPSAVVAGCSGSSTTPQPASHVYTVDERETDSSGRLGIHQGIPMS